MYQLYYLFLGLSMISYAMTGLAVGGHADSTSVTAYKDSTTTSSVLVFDWKHAATKHNSEEDYSYDGNVQSTGSTPDSKGGYIPVGMTSNPTAFSPSLHWHIGLPSRYHLSEEREVPVQFRHCFLTKDDFLHMTETQLDALCASTPP